MDIVEPVEYIQIPFGYALPMASFWLTLTPRLRPGDLIPSLRN